MGVPCAGTLLGSCCPLRFQSVCGGTHARDASLRADCRSGEDGFIEGPTPFGRRLRQKAPRDRVPSSAHAVRFASRAPVGVPAPGSLRSVSGVALVRAASLEGVCPMEDNSDGGRPVTGHPPRLMLSASLPEIACGGTRSRRASVRVGCRSVWVVFVGGHAPLRRRFRQEPPRLSPPASREAKGVEVSADESHRLRL